MKRNGKGAASWPGYILRDGEKSVVLRADQIDRLLGRGDGDAALLYLCLLRNDGAIEPRA